MPYLICEKCGKYYEFQKGESIDEIIICECGGKLNFVASLDEAPVHTFKTFRDLLSYRNFFILLIGFACVFFVGIPSIVGFEDNIAHFEGNWISFNYPNGWNLEENAFNEYNASVSGSNGYNHFYIDKKLKSDSDEVILSKLLSSGISHETMKIDGITAHKFIKAYDKYGNADIIVYLVKGNIIYNLKFYGNSKDVDEALDVVIKSFHIK